LQPEFAAKALQQINIALRALAEGEIAPGHHPVRAEAFDEDALDEVLCARPGEFRIEVEHQHRSRACREIELLPLLQRRQPEGRHIGAEVANRVRIEGRDYRGAALGLRPADRFACHGLMTAMKPVEIAQRNHCTAQGFGHGIAVIKPAHQDAPALRNVRNENAGCGSFAA
jgi:hypothetical protein